MEVGSHSSRSAQSQVNQPNVQTTRDTLYYVTPSLLEIVLFGLEPVPLLGQRLDLLQHLLRVELEAVGLLRLGIEPRVKLRDL